MLPAVVRDPRGYLGAAVLGVALLLLLGHVALASSVGTVYIVDIVAIITLVAMVVLWSVCRTTTKLGRSQIVFLSCAFVAWALAVTQVVFSGAPTQPSLMIVGALVGLLLIKPPGRDAAGQSLDLLCAGIVVVALIALALEVLGFRSSWYATLTVGELPAFEREAYWIPLADVLGLDGRWAGPFDHPSRAGVVGAVIAVWGASRGGARRIALVAAGLLMVLLAGSNTAYLAVFIGMLALLVPLWLSKARRVMPWAVGAAVLGALGLAVLVVVGPNIGLSGRTTIWPTYLDLWRGSPWTGVGDAGVGAALSDGRLPAWAYHAHNSWLDLLARHGVVVLAFSAVAMVAAVIAALPDAIAGRAASLALLAVLLTASLTQPVVGWLVPTVPAVVLVLAVMFAQPRVLASTSP